MAIKALIVGSLVVMSTVVGCRSDSKSTESTSPVSVESQLVDPICKDKVIRLCLHRFPAPDLEKKKYDACLLGEYNTCTGQQ